MTLMDTRYRRDVPHELTLVGTQTGLTVEATLVYDFQRGWFIPEDEGSDPLGHDLDEAVERAQTGYLGTKMHNAQLAKLQITSWIEQGLRPPRDWERGAHSGLKPVDESE